MKRYALIFILVTGASSLNAHILSSLNIGYGTFIHKIRRLFSSEIDNKLKSEHEKKIRDIAHKMGISADILIHAYPPEYKFLGPHCVGNRLYFDDEWFDDWAEYPQVQRFIIGHELVHAEKNHLPLRWIFRVVLILGALLLCVLVGIIYRLRSRQSNTGSFIDTFIMVGGAAVLLSLFGMFWISRQQEYEADASALELLGPHYGADTIAEGAALYFAKKCSFAQYSVLQKCIATHPHVLDRLKRMPVLKEISQQAVPNVLPLIKGQMVLRALGLYQDAVLGVAPNWDELIRTVRLSTIDKETRLALLSFLDKNELMALFKSLLKRPVPYEVLEQFGDYAPLLLEAIENNNRSQDVLEARIAKDIKDTEQELDQIIAVLS